METSSFFLFLMCNWVFKNFESYNRLGAADCFLKLRRSHAMKAGGPCCHGNKFCSTRRWQKDEIATHRISCNFRYALKNQAFLQRTLYLASCFIHVFFGATRWTFHPLGPSSTIICWVYAELPFCEHVQTTSVGVSGFRIHWWADCSRTFKYFHS